MRRRYLWAGLVTLIAVTVASSAAAMSSHSQKSTVLRMAIGAEPPSLDPGLATDTTSASVLFNLMDPLIRLGKPPALKATPGAASSWSVKGKTVTLNLRHDVRWTNGQPVTAQDYVYAWLRTISPELAADYAYQFFGITGAEAYSSCDPAKANCNALRSKVGIKAVGKWKLVITLTSAQPWFVQQLSHTSFLPVNKAAVTKWGNKWTEPGHIVTDGPFKLTSWKHDASLTLVKNTKYRLARKVKLTRIEMPIIVDGTTAENAFRAGNVDIDENSVPAVDIPSWKKTKFWHVYKSLGTYYYGFNVKNITNVNQRRAMAISIDRNQIVTFITQSGQIPARGFTPNGISGGPTIDKHSSMPVRSQLAQAKALMAKVSNPVKNIKLYVNNSPNHVKIATGIQAFWKELGLNVTIKVQEWAQFLQFLGPPPNSDVDVYRLGWIYDFPDAYNGLVLWTCDSGNNNTNWCNKKYDKLITKATNTPNNAARTKIYQQAEDILTGPKGDLPIMPIYWYTQTALVKTNVKGFFITPTDNWDLAVVSIH